MAAHQDCWSVTFGHPGSADASDRRFFVDDRGLARVGGQGCRAPRLKPVRLAGQHLGEAPSVGRQRSSATRQVPRLAADHPWARTVSQRAAGGPPM